MKALEQVRQQLRTGINIEDGSCLRALHAAEAELARTQEPLYAVIRQGDWTMQINGKPETAGKSIVVGIYSHEEAQRIYDSIPNTTSGWGVSCTAVELVKIGAEPVWE